MKELRRNLVWGGVLLMIALLWAIFNYQALNEDVKNIFINIVSSLLAGFFAIFIWEKITAELQSNEKEYVVQSINTALGGLRDMDVDRVFNKASKLLKDCREIRVIGTTKQDHHDGAIKSSIDKYLQATINRLESSDRIDYQRITSNEISDSFKNHLISGFEVAEEHNQRYELMMIADFVPAYTYLIIDDKFLMVSLNHPQLSSAPKSHSSFYTEDKDIIDRFVNHFKDVWEVEKRIYSPIADVESFSYNQDFKNRIEESINIIRKSINTFPDKKRVYSNHILDIVNQTASRLEGLSSGQLELNHNEANGNMVALFCLYFDSLHAGDKYKTITFLKFWKNFIDKPTAIKRFLKKNEDAISRQAILERTLVIPKRLLDDLDASKIEISHEDVVLYKKIIDLNLKLKNELKREHEQFYDFRVLISGDHDEYQKQLYNFAYIEKSSYDQEVIFQPSSTDQISDTLVCIHDSDLPNKVSLNIQSKIKRAKGKLEDISVEWKLQKEEEQLIAFLKKIGFDRKIINQLLYDHVRFKAREDYISSLIMYNNTGYE